MKKTILPYAVLAFLSYSNQAQTVTDYDGNVYHTVTIGTQVWLKENLKVTHYRDGTLIPNDTSAVLWNGLSSGARCYYLNDSVSNAFIYGALYNWYAATDTHKICPAGWHVPSESDWKIMEKYLDNSIDTNGLVSGFIGTDIGCKLKETGTAHWDYPNTYATNSSGFTALPGCRRYADGTFETSCTFESLIGYTGYWWTTLYYYAPYSMMRALYADNNKIYHGGSTIREGLSIRCVRDSLSNQINENSIEKHLQIYPNPATERVYIDINESQNLKIQVYNIIGDCVIQSNLNNGTNEIEIISLTKGIYIIKVTGTNWTLQRKLIKE